MDGVIMEKTESYCAGYDDGMNNFLAEAYQQRPEQYSHCEDLEEYRLGYEAGWEEMQRIDDMVE
jgi:hypothetical protein